MREERGGEIDAGLHALAAEIDVLLEQLAPTPLPVPPQLASVAGASGPGRLTLATRRSTGPCFASLTVARMEVQVAGAAPRLCSLTVVGLPPVGTPWPVLGIDVVALRGALSLLALDLAPMDRPFWDRHCAELLRETHRHAALAVVERRRPEFAAETFSPLALLAGARPGHERRALAAAAEFVRGTTALFLASGEQPAAFNPAAAGHQHRWLASERRNRKEHNALAQLFGADFAAEYLDGFLFAEAS